MHVWLHHREGAVDSGRRNLQIWLWAFNVRSEGSLLSSLYYRAFVRCPCVQLSFTEQWESRNKCIFGSFDMKFPRTICQNHGSHTTVDCILQRFGISLHLLLFNCECLYWIYKHKWCIYLISQWNHLLIADYMWRYCDMIWRDIMWLMT